MRRGKALVILSYPLKCNKDISGFRQARVEQLRLRFISILPSFSQPDMFKLWLMSALLVVYILLGRPRLFFSLFVYYLLFLFLSLNRSDLPSKKKRKNELQELQTDPQLSDNMKTASFVSLCQNLAIPITQQCSRSHEHVIVSFYHLLVHQENAFSIFT